MLPIITPPFDNTWVEFAIQREWVGVHVYDTPATEWRECLRSNLPEPEISKNLPPETERLLVSEMYSSVDHRSVAGPCATAFTPVGPDGIPLKGIGRLSLREEFEDSNLGQGCFNGMTVALLSFCFMHMRNVTTTTAELAPKLAKRYQERHGVQPAKMNVIVIDPAKEVLKKEGRINEVGLNQALHLVRRHYATYTPEKPLFGIPGNHGRFLRRQHTKGSAEFGVNLPSYIIKAPAK
jgi:hypothetical protein